MKGKFRKKTLSLARLVQLKYKKISTNIVVQIFKLYSSILRYIESFMSQQNFVYS